ncbi:hypothetical protein U27_06508 [Candidatus Vecturithrix granuli]|uniref:Uncharacterized protein n=1 Tax=Vecturithrix granuli TaxID=1499967 RepID=A0A081C4L8_VECG1|nr:hypothetical protein U27_06508 [Candidatus Vecturithrix granuli]
MAKENRTITVGRDYFKRVEGNVTTGASIHGDHAQQLVNAQQYAETITPQSSKADVAQLLAMVKEALAQSSLPEDVKKEAANEIEGAQLQVAKKEPDKPKMAGKLKAATEALEESSKTFESAVKIGNMLGKAILWGGVQWAAWRYGA